MVSDLLVPGTFLYNVVYIGLIIFFCYFYTAVDVQPEDVADNMKKYGGYVPGIRPGSTDRRVHRSHSHAPDPQWRDLHLAGLHSADACSFGRSMFPSTSVVPRC